MTAPSPVADMRVRIVDVQELRETESSKYTVRDTPTFTCVQSPMEIVLDQLF